MYFLLRSPCFQRVVLARAAPFRQLDALFAKRAFFRFIRRNGQMKQGFRPDAEVHFSAAAVDEEAHTDHVAAMGTDDIHDFPHAPPASDNISQN